MNKTRETIEKILEQAKESMKVLELLQKEGMAKAKSMVNKQLAEDTLKATNEKVVATMRKLGFATSEDVRQLEQKVDELANELRSQIVKLSKKSSSSKNVDANL